MKALEKDREKRYQTAWEMQYDLDQFLSQYEFTPSNIHLSNFLKQLFNDELEEEKDRLQTFRQQNIIGPDEVIQEEEDVVSVVEAISDMADMDEPQKIGPAATLTLQLPGGQMDQLAAIAKRNGMSVTSLVRDVLGGFLKFR